MRKAVRSRLYLLSSLAALATLIAGITPAAAQIPASAATGVYPVTFQYVVHFYPRWVSYQQQRAISAIGGIGSLAGPDHMGPAFGLIVAPNDDTLYAGSFINVAAQPLILTIPPTSATFSVQSTDVYGNVFQSVPSGKAGRYALASPGWKGDLPAGVTRVDVPVDMSFWAIRADKYSSTGADQIPEAARFRRGIHLTTLSGYLKDPSAGAVTIRPLILFSPRLQARARKEITLRPVAFLRQLQAAMHAPTTPPLTGGNLRLSQEFDRLFGDGRSLPPGDRARFASATRAAQALFLASYRNHTGRTNWVSYPNIGAWGTSYLDRAGATAYLQYGNLRSVAAYYHAFKDSRGVPLSGAGYGYVLTFARGQFPEAKRFWSVTAYVPDSLTLVPNPARKYAVASYTPGLQAGPDGSVSIYLAATRPAGVPEANWLPVPAGPFNVILRVYGPEGRVLDNSYDPPAIMPFG